MVALHAVTDLMAEGRGEFTVRRQQLIEAPRDQDVSARRGKRVDFRRVDHAERPRQVRATGLRGDPAADEVDAPLRGGIVPQRPGAEDAASDLRPEREFLGRKLVLGFRDDLGGIVQLRADVHAQRPEQTAHGLGGLGFRSAGVGRRLAATLAALGFVGIGDAGRLPALLGGIRGGRGASTRLATMLSSCAWLNAAAFRSLSSMPRTPAVSVTRPFPALPPISTRMLAAPSSTPA